MLLMSLSPYPQSPFKSTAATPVPQRSDLSYNNLLKGDRSF